MNKAVLNDLAEQFARLGETLKVAIDYTLPVTARTCVDVLNQAPTDMSQLPAFFASLTRDQLDAVWVSAIVSAAAEGEYQVSDLNRALLAVRHWPNGLVVKLETPRGGSPRLRAGKPRARRREGRKLTDHQAQPLQQMLEATTREGSDGVVRLADLFSDVGQRQLAKWVAEQSGLFNVTRVASRGRAAIAISRNEMTIEASEFAGDLRALAAGERGAE